ncbi:Gfo/Idh/MocA family protein [Vagococcus silagei]|uniref:Gfo/Idh/MocA family oxidoreductase n=1 Tax=Vagococcus silagei TaxID=2508885 RepID=A0A4S3B1J2_9ENTE|nr:Gfo/Idh/MocA family oxidoreductase [Vagococcus silagei]THB60298.1 Gfo/Idh/MocA family oxidoreductase [Vagococcus silagei]
MLNLGIIGTNWITHQFVEAALESEAYQLKGVYSRSEKKAKKFAEKYQDVTDMVITENFSEFIRSPQLDVIYIASPNSLHFDQAQEAIQAGKHVIVEKPIVSTPSELRELVDFAEEKEVFVFEAARHIHEVNFNIVKDMLKKREDVLGAQLNFMKYSSRYDAVLRGEEPNIFSPKYSGGALMDLGVYLIYAAVSWFGTPKEVFYFDQKLPTGVDGIGTMIFRYDTFDITLQTGKNADCYLPSEIYLSDGTLTLDAVNSIEEITLKTRGKDQVTATEHAVKSDVNPMIAEALAFSNVIQNPFGVEEQKNYQEWIRLAIDVHDIMFELREKSQIVFDADQ